MKNNYNFLKYYQRRERVDEEQSSWQFPRSPVHEGVGLDVEGVGEVDHVQRFSVDRERGSGKNNFFSFLCI